MLVALALSIVGVVLGSIATSSRSSTSQQATSSVTAPAPDAAVVVDMRELVANMTLLRELVEAQANTIVFLEARVRILEETSDPTLVPSSAPTPEPTFAPSREPTTSSTSNHIVPTGVVVWFASSSPAARRIPHLRWW